MLRRVVVTGLGAVTPLGVGVRRTWQRLLAGDSGIVDISDREPRAQWAQLPSTVAGVVPEGAGGAAAGVWDVADWLEASEQRRMSRFTQFAMAAAEMALAQGGWPCETDVRDLEARVMTGVCIGSGIGNLEEICNTSRAFFDPDGGGYRRVSPLFVPRILINLAAGHVAMRHGFQGPNHAATTACTTGAHAIGDAARFIALGDANVMLAGGAEACIHPLTLAGFGRSRSLAPCRATPAEAPWASRPFDRRRAGFVVAEGAAVLLLEELEHARARGAPILAELRGSGYSGDAYHMTAPHPHGAGALRAMRRALETAGLRPCDIDYINAHATSTPIGDRAEAAAIRTLMLEDAHGVARESDVTVSSTKGALGHLLGAAGAIEALFCVLAITDNIVPPTLNLEDPDVGPAFNFVAQKPQEKTVNVALTNSFGFGGTNASLKFYFTPYLSGQLCIDQPTTSTTHDAVTQFKFISAHWVSPVFLAPPFNPANVLSRLPAVCQSACPVLSSDGNDSSGSGGDHSDSSSTSTAAADAPGLPCPLSPLSTTTRTHKIDPHYPAAPAKADDQLGQPGIAERLGDMARQAVRRTVEPYGAFGVTRQMYQKCSRQAAYDISEESRRNDTVLTTEDGEEIGVGGGMWHEDFHLLPSFSTWSQVTMLHMYLVVARLRCFDKETYQLWQSMLTDHFFQEAEDRMDRVHHISSRGLRQRHLQDLFMTWRGVIVAYDEGLVRSDAILASALWRNLFKARSDMDLRALAAVVAWMRRSFAMLDRMPDETLVLHGGSGIFAWPAAAAHLPTVDEPATKELAVLLQDKAEEPLVEAPAETAKEVAAA